MNKSEQTKYEKVLLQNEILREELIKVKCFNFDKIIKRIKNANIMDEVLDIRIKSLENKVCELSKENEFLKSSLKKQLAKNLYMLINSKDENL